MARIRSVKPEFWGDQKLARLLSRDARLLYVGLWNFADEHCRCAGDARWVKGQVFPYDDDLTPDLIDDLIDDLAEAGRVTRYAVDGDAYLHLPKMANHQRLEPGKVPSRLPDPADADSSVRRADKSARRADETTQITDENPETAPDQGTLIRADESARDADRSGPIDALQVAGGREQVAGKTPAATTSRGRSPRPATPATAEDEIACAVYDHAEGMVEYVAVRGIAKRALKTQGATVPAVSAAMRAVYDAGKPITMQTVGQRLAGKTNGTAADERLPGYWAKEPR